MNHVKLSIIIVTFNSSRYIKDCLSSIEQCCNSISCEIWISDNNSADDTIEIAKEFKGKFDNWIFGCDICQDVCPWNQKFTVETLIKDFHPQNKELNLADIDKMIETDFKERFRVSPIKRAKLSGLKRNASFLKKND